MPGQALIRSGLAIYSLACTLSLVLFFAYGTTNDTLNDDGINYIYAAHALAEGLPEQAKTYRPEVLFYSQITALSSLSGLDLYPSAQLLSLFWQILLATGFVAIVRCFDTSLQSQIIALAVFFSIANLNHLRPDIIRGFGFWALQLWAIWAGLNFLKHKAWRFVFLWLGFSAAAILYRSEGIVYFFLVPVFTLLNTVFTNGPTLKDALKITGIIAMAGGALYFVFVPESTSLQSISATDKLQREVNTFKLAADNFKQLKDDIGAAMPNKWAQRSVNDLLIGGFIFHLLLTLIKATNAPLIALSLYRNDIKRPICTEPRHKLLASYLLVGLIVGLFSVYNKYFVSPRYIMLTAILLCIPATFLLSRSYSRFTTSKQGRARLWKYALFALPVLICLYPLSRQNDDKLYLREAGEWVKSNLNGEQNIYFNQQKVAFYASNYTNDSFKAQYTSKEGLLHEGYQYAVLYERPDSSGQVPPIQGLREHRVKAFTNSRGRSVNVYKLPAPKR